MAEPYVGEIRMFAGNFAPVGWAFCEGQLLSISENSVLFNIIGTTYGGDGQNYFALPDLRGRIPIHRGNGFNLADSGGAETVALTTGQLPAHSHALQGSSNVAQQGQPHGNVPGRTAGSRGYSSANPTLDLANTAVRPIGGSQPHTNLQPYLCLNFIISLYGIYPSST